MPKRERRLASPYHQHNTQPELHLHEDDEDEQVYLLELRCELFPRGKVRLDLQTYVRLRQT